MPGRTLLLTGLRDLVRRPLQTGLMVLGVALGVAVVIAIDIANGAARRGFEESAEAIVGRATHEVRGGPSGLPEDLLARVRLEAGVEAVAPVVEGTVIALDLDRQPLRLLGLDPLSEGPFRNHLGGGLRAHPGLARFLADERAVLLGAGLARRYRLGIGSPLRLQVQDRIETLEIMGLVHPGGEAAGAALDGLVLMDVGAAQRLLGMSGRLTRLDLIASDSRVAALERLLPEGASLTRTEKRSDAIRQLTAAFSLNLRALSLLALVVGMFLIYNTVTFSVVQRRAVLGTLRALGTTPAQVFLLVLVETAAAAAVGTIAGLGLGWLLGQGAVRLVTRTINDLYFLLAVTEAPLTVGTAAKGALLGIGAGILAAVPAALEAARVEPVVALRPSTLASRSRRLLPWVAGAGLVIAALGTALLGVFPRSLGASFAGLFGIVLGLALLVPLATVAAMSLFAWPVALVAGTLGRIATRTVARSVGRTGVAVAALMVAVSVTIGVGLMIQGFRATVENWLDLSLRADVFIAAPLPGGAREGPSLAPEVVSRVTAVPGVVGVETFRAARVASPSGEVRLAVADTRRARPAALYRFAEGGPDEIWKRVTEGAVIVSEPFAYRRGLPAHGGAVTLQTDNGLATFPVAGVFYDYATEQGLVLMSRNVYERYFEDRGISSLGVYVAEGRSAEEVAFDLRRALVGTALQVTPNRALRAHALRVFDRTFAVTEALRLLAVAVAFIGVCSALMALQVERTRELATLVALGLTPGQLRKLTLLESGLMGLLAGVLSLPTGLLLAVILTDVINVRSFGWTMRLVSSPSVFAQALLSSVLGALLASLYPLRRLERMPLSSALRQE
jgi:putative ABC transport system permease protein